MFGSVLTAAIRGVDSVPVRVEADVSSGLPMFNMVGYLSAQVKEAQERVRTAIKNAGITIPPKRITVNLSPADVRKDGNRFDLPIAAALLTAFGYVEEKKMSGVMLAGELSLDGKINAVRGILPLAESAKKLGCSLCIVPEENRREAEMAGGISVLGVRSLKHFVECAALEDWGIGKQSCPEKGRMPLIPPSPFDFSDIKGQESAKRAALVAAAGFHNLLMMGEKGAGKTMIARRIPTIMPQLSYEECVEISRLHSIAGLLSKEQPLLTSRPFRAPHHTISRTALAGGGKYPRPGEITLAHRGILFLDEFPEFSRESIEILRQPMEEHRILISRVGGIYEFPAHCMVVAAMNHCPCGNYPDMNRCTCTLADRKRYTGKISGPILDRMDICIELTNVTYEELEERDTECSSGKLRGLAEQAFKVQRERYAGQNISFNSELQGDLLRKYCQMTGEGRRILEKAFEKMNLTARAYHKILKTARTIADLETEEIIREAHISEAVSYRIPEL